MHIPTLQIMLVISASLLAVVFCGLRLWGMAGQLWANFRRTDLVDENAVLVARIAELMSLLESLEKSDMADYIDRDQRQEIELNLLRNIRGFLLTHKGQKAVSLLEKLGLPQGLEIHEFLSEVTKVVDNGGNNGQKKRNKSNKPVEEPVEKTPEPVANRVAEDWRNAL